MDQAGFIKKRQAEILAELADYLLEYNLPLTAEEVLAEVLHDDDEFEDFMMLLAGGDPLAVEWAQELAMELFNYFPRESLSGKTYAETLSFADLQKVDAEFEAFKNGESIKTTPEEKDEKMKELMRSREEYGNKVIDLEKRITFFLEKNKSSVTLDQIKDLIHKERQHADLVKVMELLGPDKSAEFDEEAMFLANEAWNHFPHKLLDDLSPAEKILESQFLDLLDEAGIPEDDYDIREGDDLGDIDSMPRSGTWEVGQRGEILFSDNKDIPEDMGLKVAAVAHQGSGFLLALRVFRPIEKGVAPAFRQAIKQHQQLPDFVWVSQDDVYAELEPLAREYNFQLARVAKLKEVPFVFKSMKEDLESGDFQL